jgi:hypothetical protein
VLFLQSSSTTPACGFHDHELHVYNQAPSYPRTWFWSPNRERSTFLYTVRTSTKYHQRHFGFTELAIRQGKSIIPRLYLYLLAPLSLIVLAHQFLPPFFRLIDASLAYPRKRRTRRFIFKTSRSRSIQIHSHCGKAARFILFFHYLLDIPQIL